MVFQNYALWPHMTVRQNVSYPLKTRTRLGQEQHRQVIEALQLVGLEGHAERYPSELSGGQQQRVALARALVARPALMLFDEPLSNMDAQLRIRLRQDLRRIHDGLGYTAVYVTHDHAEALALADRVAVMNAGRLEQVGTLSEIFWHRALISSPSSSVSKTFCRVRSPPPLTARLRLRWTMPTCN